jgi:aminoglycoside/choline kinase family phosphotransferase/dTDP-glucose pyrophosphorylase
MNALILAAGFGTRLMPYTRSRPKPLFTIGGRPLLDFIIKDLVRSGCDAIVINTHHLHGQIESFVRRTDFGVPVTTRYEPEILGTGGAIRNTADLRDERPFFVVNADILTTIDYRALYDAHCLDQPAATLALADDPRFNTVSVNGNGDVLGFGGIEDGEATAVPGLRQTTFTGIQVLSPEILDEIPEAGFSSSIDAFRNLLRRGKRIKGVMDEQAAWSDLGTPGRYRAAVLETMGYQGLQSMRPSPDTQPARWTRLKGDGSDRAWHRCSNGRDSLALVDHGIREGDGTAEVDAYVDIGNHLRGKGVPIPLFRGHDRFAGVVVMDDLGDRHLQDLVLAASDDREIIALYEKVIDTAIPMWIRGAAGFDPAWAWQTARYDRSLILEAECGYFQRAFVEQWAGQALEGAAFTDEFERLAAGAVTYGLDGFIHRDFQSRNIMVKDGTPYFIDFQGGRLGPVQYDLASLLIDPYVGLAPSIQDAVAVFCAERISEVTGCDPEVFLLGCAYCRITRNLQILGAFGFLTLQKGKKQFEAYIAPALASLSRNLNAVPSDSFPTLSGWVSAHIARYSATKHCPDHPSPRDPAN